MKIIDTKGKLCPEPLIMAKKALSEIKDGEQLEIIADNETSYKNLMRFLADTKTNPQCTQSGNTYHIICTKNLGQSFTNTNPESYCEIEQPSKLGKYVISITSNKMGQGDDDLGKILIKAFVNTIKELDSLPSNIVFYNSGVLLTQSDCDLVDSLKHLQGLGIKILVCGTCANFYNIQDKIGVGIISNMYDISNALINADHIVTP